MVGTMQSNTNVYDKFTITVSNELKLFICVMVTDTYVITK